ncbi:redoxin domain-containing protein [Candidatus Daviesbacteria bacterium]|nr:redoxin domain-containing protein [Candidatus Daviesbacteria bacterium]
MAGINAPEFPEGLWWLNSQPLTMNRLLGKVVLIDFWTYSCINCQRTLPYLQKWWEKYSDKGFVLIGVHTPEFEFEKSQKNVKAALKKYSVSWPVALDNDYQIWNSYANHYWPAKYLVDHKSKVIYTHFGEGNYVETEVQIQNALKEAGFKVPDTTVGQLLEEKYQAGQTPETYCGSKRGSVIELKSGYDSKDLKSDQIYVVGEWNQEEEYLEHTRQTADLENILVLKYRAKKVYLVMESTLAEPIKVYVTLDGVGLKDNGAGYDIKFDSEQRSFVEVQFSTLYNLVETKDIGEHVLRISSAEKGLRMFAFTFGS